MSDCTTQIMDAVGPRLANITEANGYATTVQKIKRAMLTPFKPHDIPAINYWWDTDNLESTGNGFEKRRMDVLIEYHAKTRDEPFTDVAARLAADVWVALWRDTASPAVADPVSAHLGGIVSGMRLTDMEPQIGQGQTPYCGVLLRVSVTYKRRPENPFVLVT